MKQLLFKYSDKLVNQGLCNPGDPLFGAIDSELMWNRDSFECDIFEGVVNNLNINSILFSKPAEPFFSILNYLSEKAITGDLAILPQDTESRMFLHDIPVTDQFSSENIIKSLKKRKSLVIKNHGIVTFGTVSPEQAFVTYSSVCFSCYVKFFMDYYYMYANNSNISEKMKLVLEDSISIYEKFLIMSQKIFPEKKGPFNNVDDILDAIIEAGNLVIESRMVDSFFGNISYKSDDVIYISQTGSSMDELKERIDSCPVDNSSCNAITASSEFTAHKSIYNLTGNMAILHGHPKFSAIISMLCNESNCDNRGMCHLKCSKKRYIDDIPIVPGEVGTGPLGLCNTLPPAMAGRGAIVYGHGLFTNGKVDFTDAYRNLVEIEKRCLEKFKDLTALK